MSLGVALHSVMSLIVCDSCLCLTSSWWFVPSVLFFLLLELSLWFQMQFVVVSASYGYFKIFYLAFFSKSWWPCFLVHLFFLVTCIHSLAFPPVLEQFSEGSSEMVV